MYLIVSNHEDRILAIAEEVTYQSNGYPVANGIAFYNAKVEEVPEVPEGVERYTWAYTNGEFIQIVIPEPSDEATESDYINALEELGVEFNEED